MYLLPVRIAVKVGRILKADTKDLSFKSRIMGTLIFSYGAARVAKNFFYSRNKIEMMEMISQAIGIQLIGLILEIVGTFFFAKSVFLSDEEIKKLSFREMAQI